MGQRLNMARGSFTRDFNKRSHLSAGDCLKQERLKRAESLLTCTDVSPGKISDMVGYRNPAAMRHAFQQAHDCAPTIWRQQRS